jgi:hypothetical protein
MECQVEECRPTDDGRGEYRLISVRTGDGRRSYYEACFFPGEDPRCWKDGRYIPSLYADLRGSFGQPWCKELEELAMEEVM